MPSFDGCNYVDWRNETVVNYLESKEKRFSFGNWHWLSLFMENDASMIVLRCLLFESKIRPVAGLKFSIIDWNEERANRHSFVKQKVHWLAHK